MAKNLKEDFLWPQNDHFRDPRFSDRASEEKELTWNLLSDFSRLAPQFKNLKFLSYGIGRWENANTIALLSPFIPFATKRFESIGDPLAGCSFECLTALKLHLPSTYTFNLAFHSLGSEVLGRMKHLYFEITDKTGEGGRPLLDNEYAVPVSNYLQQYPVKEYSGEFFRWIAMCTQLESLSITGAQLLDSKELQWKPKREGLNMLDLHRIQVTETTLIDLMSTSTGTPSSATSKISLTYVELTAGTWHKVFRHMDNMSALVYLCPLNLRYSNKGSSSKFRKPGFYDEAVFTKRPRDEIELLSLYQKLDGLARAAGLKHPVDRGENGIVTDSYQLF